MLQLLAEINRELKLTIVLITHEMDVIRRVCDVVAVMDAGKVVEQGPVADVFLRTTPTTDASCRKTSRSTKANSGTTSLTCQAVSCALTFRANPPTPLLGTIARETGWTGIWPVVSTIKAHLAGSDLAILVATWKLLSRAHRRGHCHGGAALMEALLSFCCYRLVRNLVGLHRHHGHARRFAAVYGVARLATGHSVVPVPSHNSPGTESPVFTALSFVVNILRSLPFIILLVVMIPFTVLITGTSLGVAGAIPPLVVGATPFFARLVETAFQWTAASSSTRSNGRQHASDHYRCPLLRKHVPASLRQLR